MEPETVLTSSCANSLETFEWHSIIFSVLDEIFADAFQYVTRTHAHPLVYTSTMAILQWSKLIAQRVAEGRAPSTIAFPDEIWFDYVLARASDFRHTIPKGNQIEAIKWYGNDPVKIIQSGCALVDIRKLFQD